MWIRCLPNMRLSVVLDGLSVLLWMVLTSALLLTNKYILTRTGFHFPIALTLWHMCFSTGLAAACVWGGLTPSIDIPWDLYLKRVLPISACYAGSLWLSNAAYRVCSVSFVQMVKSGMPVTVYLLGLVFKTEKFSWPLAADVTLITAGVGVSAWGEAELVVGGLLLVLGSMCCEAARLTLVQKLLQASSIRLNPLTTLYYIAPPAAGLLCIPFLLMEARKVAVYFAGPVASVTVLWLNALNAFALNLAVFLLIGRTSALTLNVSGLVKDIGTITLSVIIFGNVVTTMNITGYAIVLVAVAGYNYIRLFGMPSPEPANAPQKAPPDPERAIQEAVDHAQEAAAAAAAHTRLLSPHSPHTSLPQSHGGRGPYHHPFNMAAPVLPTPADDEHTPLLLSTLPVPPGRDGAHVGALQIGGPGRLGPAAGAVGLNGVTARITDAQEESGLYERYAGSEGASTGTALAANGAPGLKIRSARSTFGAGGDSARGEGGGSTGAGGGGGGGARGSSWMEVLNPMTFFSGGWSRS